MLEKLQRSVGEKCWRRVLEMRFVVKCCRELLEKSVVESKSCREVLEESVGEEGCREVW